MSEAVVGDARPDAGTRPPPRSAWARVVGPVLVPVLLLVALDLVLRVGVGRPDAFPGTGAYRATMDVAVLGRTALLVASSLVVWPVMWLRGASFGERVIGVLAVPATWAVLSIVTAWEFFPPAQALFYGTNPLVAGSIGAQVATAAVGGSWARWRWRRRSGAALRVVTPGAVVALVLGTAVPVMALLRDGGIHWFYVWMQLYVALFGSGV